jgi:hypothetical protein
VEIRIEHLLVSIYSIAAAGLSRFGEASGKSLQPGSRGVSFIPPGKPFQECRGGDMKRAALVRLQLWCRRERF